MTTTENKEEVSVEALTGEVEQLRHFASIIYAGLGAECDLPEAWLDALLAASEGRPFSTKGLLPFTASQNPAIPDDIRAEGWSVAVHNDYKQNGKNHTFWLFTMGSRNVKGEGLSDTVALNQVRHQIGLPRLKKGPVSPFPVP